MNHLLPFFWWIVNFLYFLCFISFFWFTSWSNFISYFISNQISSSFCSFWTTVLEAVFVSVSINYFSIFITRFSCKWQNSIFFNIFSVFSFCWISYFYIYPMISVKLALSLILSALLIWSVNQTSTEKNSVLTVFIIVKECDEILSELPISKKSK